MTFLSIIEAFMAKQRQNFLYVQPIIYNWVYSIQWEFSITLGMRNVPVCSRAPEARRRPDHPWSLCTPIRPEKVCRRFDRGSARASARSKRRLLDWREFAALLASQSHGCMQPCAPYAQRTAFEEALIHTCPDTVQWYLLLGRTGQQEAV